MKSVCITVRIPDSFDFDGKVKELLREIQDPRFAERPQTLCADIDLYYADYEKREAIFSVTSTPKNIGYIVCKILEVEGPKIIEIRRK